MKTLVLDIETTPFLSYHFKQWKTDIFPNQVVKVPEVMCFAWKWHGEDPIRFVAGRYHPRWDSDLDMATIAWDLLNHADALVTFNGDKFDIPHLNRLLQVQGLGPPSPYESIDLRRTTKRALFPYQSLNYVSQELGLGEKVHHSGLDMWIKCMEGDPEAWAEMETYDRGDVDLTDRLYTHQLPWIKNHPSHQLIDHLAELDCPRCGAKGSLIRQGVRHTVTRSYRRYQCSACKGWSKSTRSIDSVGVRDVA